ncbi:mycofactocin precursor [Streptomyces sp. SAI-144]|nr:mycofactocin precursor MftA [Streptomyces sp. SAI-144]MDH6436700.1 mycofactocin precursor [Streptomyces sp. SAI-144]
MAYEPETLTRDERPAQTGPDGPAAAEDTEALAEDVLVEEISIDGMCGVY